MLYLVQAKMLLKEQCISITDFRKYTQKYIKLSKEHPIYIFSNNKLVAKIVDPSYEEASPYGFSIHFDQPKDPRELLAELRA